MSDLSEKAWLGQLNEHLVDAGNGHRLHKDTISPFLAMQDAAQKDGIDLQLVSSYRDFDRQTAIFNRKWNGHAQLLDVTGAPLAFDTLSDNDKLHAILTWSALPGGSRHHWGTDVDVYDRAAVKNWDGDFSLVESEYDKGGPCFALSSWLDANMHRFGFYRPFSLNKGGVAVEPWHLSFKPTASVFEKARNLHGFTLALEQSDIEGKSFILPQLPTLYNRYVLNNGLKPTEFA
ncbi:M15 family metallopeptidase [Alteromonas gracilis]|uniref:M15 family metallopeptidase n=1 Tax=Alteromonas gracilis TaxID=1479524 RepID=UPI00373547AF